MNFQEKVLKSDLDEARKLVASISFCTARQRQALAAKDELTYFWWVKEARRSRRELAALYRKKELFSQEQAKVHLIVSHLQKRGIDASVVVRAHHIVLDRG